MGEEGCECPRRGNSQCKGAEAEACLRCEEEASMVKESEGRGVGDDAAGTRRGGQIVQDLEASVRTSRGEGKPPDFETRREKTTLIYEEQIVWEQGQKSQEPFASPQASNGSGLD